MGTPWVVPVLKNGRLSGEKGSIVMRVHESIEVCREVFLLTQARDSGSKTITALNIFWTLVGWNKGKDKLEG
jgi:hypothetical protein